MGKGKLKVLYIAGSGRCGSTVVAQLLGELEGFVNIGEGIYLFSERMRRRQIPCGCGHMPEQCGFWASVMKAVRQDDISWATRWIKAKYWPMFYMIRTKMWNGSDGVYRFLSAVEAVYSELARRTGARVLVDSSKHPTFGLLLTLSSTLDVRVLNLVRDARAVASSWMRQKSYLRTRSTLSVTLQWLVYNMLSRFVATSASRFMQLRWEDFVNDPVRYLSDILRFLDEDPVLLHGLRARREKTFLVNQQHPLAGNPDKLRLSQEIELRLRRWQLSRWSEATVVLLSWPLMWKYGYLGMFQRRGAWDG